MMWTVAWNVAKIIGFVVLAAHLLTRSVPSWYRAKEMPRLPLWLEKWMMIVVTVMVAVLLVTLACGSAKNIYLAVRP